MSAFRSVLDPRALGLPLRALAFAGLAIVVLDELGTFGDPRLTRGPVFLALGAICGAGALVSQGGGRGVQRHLVLGTPLLAPVLVRAVVPFAVFAALLLLRDPGRGATDVAWGLAGICLAWRSLAHALASDEPGLRVLVPVSLMGAVAVLLPDRPGLVLGPLAVAAWAWVGFLGRCRADGALLFEVGRAAGR